MEVLFKTVHGSRLYGLAHENSDHDFYTVVSKVRTAKAKYARQTIVDGVDSMVVDFGTWLRQCEMGVPQALEAMFSEQALVDKIEEFRLGYRVGTEVWSRYLRTIKSFALNEETDEKFKFKKKRHALRLSFNLNELSRYGRFNPTFDKGMADLMSLGAKHLDGEGVYDLCMQYVWSLGREDLTTH